ncbi:MAG: 2-dehydro-3-deoxyphosphooctonate aldolase [Flavobacteriaceae bacterium]
MWRKAIFFLLLIVASSCISTKLTIKNIDNTAQSPEFLDKDTYKLTQKATDKKYGYDEDYPVNLGFGLLHQREANKEKFLKALLGPNGEKITYQQEGSCCPFPTKTSELGGGMLDVYHITWEGNQKPLTLYLNTYEKGKVLIPLGLTAKN